jgi:hypothetical protein
MSFAAPLPRPLPRHIASIMDGNGRWAKARGLPRIAGHRRGAEAVRRTLVAAGQIGIRYLTLFGFSSENWKRPTGEVDDLMVVRVLRVEGVEHPPDHPLVGAGCTEHLPACQRLPGIDDDPDNVGLEQRGGREQENAGGGDGRQGARERMRRDADTEPARHEDPFLCCRGV